MKWFVVLSGLLCVPATVCAGAPEDAAGSPLQARCESRDMDLHHCPIDTSAGVELVKQLSDNTCIRGSQWDVDPEGGSIWVTLGCRGEFHSLKMPEGPLVRRVVRCESDGRQQSCPVILRGAPVRLLRQMSVWPCKEGQSWGVRRNEIWVSRGCDGEFELGAEDGSGFVDVPRMVTCESKRRSRRLCGVTIEHDARLHKQLSGSACELGRSWGWTRDGVWVDNGCRAEFVVD